MSFIMFSEKRITYFCFVKVWRNAKASYISVSSHSFVAALSYFCLGSSWAPCHWRLLMGRVGAAFIERRLSLSILFIIFWDNSTELFLSFMQWNVSQGPLAPA
jgi:hypothetical protein